MADCLPLVRRHVLLKGETFSYRISVGNASLLNCGVVRQNLKKSGNSVKQRYTWSRKYIRGEDINSSRISLSTGILASTLLDFLLNISLISHISPSFCSRETMLDWFFKVCRLTLGKKSCDILRAFQEIVPVHSFAFKGQ